MANFGIPFLVICAVISIHVTGTLQKQVRPAKEKAAKIPDDLLGVFSNDKDKLNHVTALWILIHDNPFILNISLVKGNTIEFARWDQFLYRNHDGMMDFDYQYCFTLGDKLNKRCIPFRLNKISFLQARKRHQVMFTVVDGAIRAVIQSPSECGFLKTLMSFVPREGGIAVSFNGDPAALYTPALPEYMFGAWQLDANNTLIEAANVVFQSFAGNKDRTLWTNLTSIWISRAAIHRDNEFLFKMAFDRNNVMSRDYRLVNGTLLEFNEAVNKHLGHRSPEQATLNKNSIVQKIHNGPEDLLTFRYAFHEDHMLQTVEVNNNNLTAVLTYNRTVPWHFYGTFEEIKESATGQVRAEKDMIASEVSSQEPCNGTRRIRIYPDPSTPNVVFEETGCTSRALRFRLTEEVEEWKNITDGDNTLFHHTSTSIRLDLPEVISISAARREQDQGASARIIENIWFKLTADPYDLGLDMDYHATAMILHSSENRPQQQDSRFRSRFRRIVSPTIFGQFKATGPHTVRDHMVQIIQGTEDQFHHKMVSSHYPDAVLNNMTFNVPAEIQPGIQSMWHYVELFDTVILTIYQTIHPGSPDFAKTDAYVMSPDGVTATDYRFGMEVVVNLTRVA